MAKLSAELRAGDPYKPLLKTKKGEHISLLVLLSIFSSAFDERMGQAILGHKGHLWPSLKMVCVVAKEEFWRSSCRLQPFLPLQALIDCHFVHKQGPRVYVHKAIRQAVQDSVDANTIDQARILFTAYHLQQLATATDGSEWLQTSYPHLCEAVACAAALSGRFWHTLGFWVLLFNTHERLSGVARIDATHLFDQLNAIMESKKVSVHTHCVQAITQGQDNVKAWSRVRRRSLLKQRQPQRPLKEQNLQAQLQKQLSCHGRP